MAARVVNVWYDNPGDFLEVCWASGEWSFDTWEVPEDEIGVEFFLTEDGRIVSFHIIGALYSPYRRSGKSQVVADVQPHPVTVQYDQEQDWWRAQWGPSVAAGIPTPNARIKALVDAAGQIQGVEIRDLRTFDQEILNQDLYPAELGVAAG